MFSQHSGARRGMTLVELLVVMVIMLILATIVVAFAPGFQDAQKVGRGADQLQGWLLMARQWAKKDRVPTGLRLFTSPDPITSRMIVTDLQYIQQPPVFAVPYAVPASSGQPAIRKISVSTNTSVTPNVSTVFLDLPGPVAPQAGQTPGDFSGGQSQVGGTADTWAVQQGDYLVIHGTICSIPPLPAASPFGLTGPLAPAPFTNLCDKFTLATPLSGNLAQIPATTDYYFVRAPRPLTGESTIKLPQDVVIDTSLSIMSSTNGQMDILFSPSGELLAPSSSNKIILWVRDRTKPLPPGNVESDTLIAIDTRTGLIAAQPVNPDQSDYYAYTRDGRPSGL